MGTCSLTDAQALQEKIYAERERKNVVAADGGKRGEEQRCDDKAKNGDTLHDCLL
jgi:hypothetical protein